MIRALAWLTDGETLAGNLVLIGLTAAAGVSWWCIR